jgi:hypothetical protein
VSDASVLELNVLGQSGLLDRDSSLFRDFYEGTAGFTGRFGSVVTKHPSFTISAQPSPSPSGIRGT